jgi:serine/threonine protein phosphatase PrpC
VVTGLNMAWGAVLLLCSDGLTAHVSDERIRERLGAMTSAKQVCEDLLRDALEGGGADNVTIIVGRALRKAD